MCLSISAVIIARRRTNSDNLNVLVRAADQIRQREDLTAAFKVCTPRHCLWL
jgi:hypothetical protein